MDGRRSVADGIRSLGCPAVAAVDLTHVRTAPAASSQSALEPFEEST
jgi:hypothetical protein